MDDILQCITDYFIKETENSDSNKSEYLRQCILKEARLNWPILTPFDNLMTIFNKMGLYFSNEIDSINCKEAVLLIAVFLKEIESNEFNFKKDEKKELYFTLHKHFILSLLKKKSEDLALSILSHLNDDSLKIKLSISFDKYSITFPHAYFYNFQDKNPKVIFFELPLGSEYETLTKKYLVELLRWSLELKDESLFIFVFDNFPFYSGESNKKIHENISTLAKELELMAGIYDDLTLLESTYLFLNKAEGKLNIFNVRQQKTNPNYYLWTFLTHKDKDIFLNIKVENGTAFIESSKQRVYFKKENLEAVFKNYRKMKEQSFNYIERLNTLKNIYFELNYHDLIEYGRNDLEKVFNLFKLTIEPTKSEFFRYCINKIYASNNQEKYLLLLQKLNDALQEKKSTSATVVNKPIVFSPYTSNTFNQLLIESIELTNLNCSPKPSFSEERQFNFEEDDGKSFEMRPLA